MDIALMAIFQMNLRHLPLSFLCGGLAIQSVMHGQYWDG